jgi:hypothetical protein
MDGRPSVIRAKCFPLRVKKIRESHIESWLVSLEEVGLVKTYEVDGKPYLQVATWDVHQHRRAKNSKFPPPENICDHMISHDGDCEQEGADERRFTRGIEESRNRGIDICVSIMDFYNETFKGVWKRPLRLTSDRRDKIKTRLKSFSEDEIREAIANLRTSKYHLGENQNGTIYATPEFLFRSDSQIDKWMNIRRKEVNQCQTGSEVERLKRILNAQSSESVSQTQGVQHT